MPVELVNLAQTDIEKNYPNWKIEKFKFNEIILSKEIEDFCDEHFVIKLVDENVEIFKQKEDELRLYKETNISKEYLTKDDINNLNNGIYVYGITNLNSVLEDFE